MIQILSSQLRRWNCEKTLERPPNNVQPPTRYFWFGRVGQFLCNGFRTTHGAPNRLLSKYGYRRHRPTKISAEPCETHTRTSAGFGFQDIPAIVDRTGAMRTLPPIRIILRDAGWSLLELLGTAAREIQHCN